MSNKAYDLPQNPAGQSRARCRKEMKMMKHIIFAIIFLTTAAICTTGNASNQNSPPTGIDINAMGGLGKFFSSEYKHRALTEDEIKKQIGPVFKKSEKKLYRLPELLQKTKDEAALRLLLNVVYYQEKHASVLNAELAETLNESFEIFFKGSTEVIENVLKDKNQKNREAIIDNFYGYVQMHGLEPNEKKLPPHLKQVKKTINNYEGKKTNK